MNPIALRFCGLSLASPLVLASGIMGMSSSSMGRAAVCGAGAVTTKSFGLVERSGHPGPAVIPFAHGCLNAVGLSNPGVDEMLPEIMAFRKSYPDTGIFASVFGRTIAEFVEMAEKTAAISPDLLELNVSCPNVASEFGTPFTADISALEKITAQVKAVAGRVPVSVKLSLQCRSLPEAALRCEGAGADAITAINTVGPGMLIDVNTRKPILSNKCGGLSGPAIFPLTVRAVYEIFRVVKIPVIATGGVSCTADALQLIMAGAAAVGIGSGVHRQGLEIFTEINKGLKNYAFEHGLDNIALLRGAAHV